MDSSEVLIEMQDNVQNDEEGRVEMNLIQQKTSFNWCYCIICTRNRLSVGDEQYVTTSYRNQLNGLRAKAAYRCNVPDDAGFVQNLLNDAPESAK